MGECHKWESVNQLVYQAADFSRLLGAVVMDCLEMFRQV